jgi:glucose dehydrogenase
MRARRRGQEVIERPYTLDFPVLGLGTAFAGRAIAVQMTAGQYFRGAVSLELGHSLWEAGAPCEHGLAEWAESGLLV